jgi:mannose-6-phosphate isomerase
MILKIENQARDYAWGSPNLIADYFGIPATGSAMAEIWLGTHPGSPARISGEDRTLAEVIGGSGLPFLLKILAAGQPLSIQAHPNAAQAAEGFARENAAGIAIDSPLRNYKDAQHKPELLVALTPFEALCGFKPLAELEALFSAIAQSADAQTAALGSSYHGLLPNGIRGIVEDALSRRDDFAWFVAGLKSVPLADRDRELVDTLASLYSADPGVLVALMMNRVSLRPGQALFVDAGVLHAYLGGLGVEIMSSSDNVLRGGLTPKNIDVAELVSVLKFDAGEVELASTTELAHGLTRFNTPVEDFVLYRAELSGASILADLNLPSDCVLLCSGGEVTVSTSKGELETLRLGEAAYLSADARLFTLAGSGTVFIASSLL